MKAKRYHLKDLNCSIMEYVNPFFKHRKNNKLIRISPQVFTHHPQTGWHLCGLTRNMYFSTKSRYIIVDCPPETYGDYVLIIKKGRGALGFREIHVRGIFTYNYTHA